MISKWYDKKEDAINLRKNGVSIRTIEKSLGIPRSTLSGWFKGTVLDSNHRNTLQNNQLLALSEARIKAAAWHKKQKHLRLLAAEESARQVLRNINVTPSLMDVAFAMLYLGGGKKSGSTSIRNSNPLVLRFVLSVLKQNYGLDPNQVSCELHIRADQDMVQIKEYWSNQLDIPIGNFTYTYIDQRTTGKFSYERYNGVCILQCGNIAIQRKLTYLYNLFCQMVVEGD